MTAFALALSSWKSRRRQAWVSEMGAFVVKGKGDDVHAHVHVCFFYEMLTVK